MNLLIALALALTTNVAPAAPAESAPGGGASEPVHVRLDGVDVRLRDATTQVVTVNRTDGYHARITWWVLRDGGWEQVAMAFGKRFPATGPDPLFAQLFVFGVSVNFVPAALGGEVLEVALIAVIHLVVVYRIRMAKGIAAKGRLEDLQRFEQLRAD